MFSARFDCSDNFSFNLNNSFIVMGVIQKLSSSKVTGYDNIPVRLLKMVSALLLILSLSYSTPQ